MLYSQVSMMKPMLSKVVFTRVSSGPYTDATNVPRKYGIEFRDEYQISDLKEWLSTDNIIEYKKYHYSRNKYCDENFHPPFFEAQYDSFK